MEKKKTRIKIKDLPKDQKVSKEEMKKVFGGGVGWLMFNPQPEPPAMTPDDYHPPDPGKFSYF